ncbi:K02A2.6-like [Cordylochernes scorpioides]|uniref:K02A2.6-like n=1 Tax=Cordylochernes scorpioides TaxID=51811 RepID=A0ABY6KHV4_9ARAC|nr:K02A2.6-like [Cordylochernes scorpioides]
MKNYYDRHTRPADPLSINDRVWFRKDKRWIPGQLKNQANEPRSFYVKDQEGNEYRRNSIHIREDKRSETTHTDWEKPLELNQEQADLQDLEETPSQPTSSGQLSSPGSPENVTTTGPPESCTNGSPGNLITTRSELAEYPFLINQEKLTTYAFRAVGPRQRGASCTSTTKKTGHSGILKNHEAGYLNYICKERHKTFLHLGEKKMKSIQLAYLRFAEKGRLSRQNKGQNLTPSIDRRRN